MAFWMFIVAIGLGIVGGGLANWLCDTLPARQVGFAAVCPNCHSQRPVWGVLFFRKCSHCGHGVSLRHYLTPVFLAAGSLVLLAFPPRLTLWLAWPVMVYFACVIIMDIEHHVILHPVSLTGAVLGAVCGVLLNGAWRTAAGGAAGFAIMLVLYLGGLWFGKMMAKRRGEAVDEEALGFGDVNLAGVIGLFLGWPLIIGGLLTAVLAGGVVSGLALIWMLVRKKYQPFMALPHAPFIAGTGMLLLYLS